MLQSKGAPDPQWVFDAYVSLAEMPAGQRPAQAVVDIARGVVETCRLTQLQMKSKHAAPLVSVKISKDQMWRCARASQFE